jgi:uncharacterized protein (DUF433 family)
MNLPDFLVDHPDGEIRLTGSRIGLSDVVYYYNEGYSAEMLAEQFPTLSLALIHKVIAFYLDNQAEVDSYVSEQETATDRLRASLPDPPALAAIRRRLLAAQRAEGR